MAPTAIIRGLLSDPLMRKGSMPIENLRMVTKALMKCHLDLTDLQISKKMVPTAHPKDLLMVVASARVLIPI